MHIGLIGGIGPAATDFYYRALVKEAASLGRDLDMTVVHADTPTLLGNLLNNDHAAQCVIYGRLTERLARAGADCVVVTSIAGHFCIDAFAEASPLPVVDLTRAMAVWLDEQGMETVGILGTAPVMASGMYGKLGDVEVLAPKALSAVHDAYVTLAQSGEPSPELKKVFDDAAAEMTARGAEGVMLGGTDLNAIYGADTVEFPVIDCAGIHVAEIRKWI